MGVKLYSWRRVNKIVSNLPGVGTAVYEQAVTIGGKAERRLATHRHPFDDTMSSVDVTRGTGGVDSFINLNDTGGGAVGIEFGYRAENGKIVHGLHIVTGAAGLA